MFYEAMNLLHVYPEECWRESKHYLAAKKIPGDKDLDIPVLDDNHAIFGTTGYGKTTLTKKIVDAAINTEEEPLVVFLETKRDFREYIRDGDKVIASSEELGTYNYFKWNFVAECRAANDPEYVLNEITKHLFAELREDKKNIFFVEGAQNIFKAFVRTILYCYSNCPGNKSVIDGMKNMGYMQLIDHILKYKQNKHIVRDYFGYDADNPGNYVMPKRTGDLLAFLSNVLDKFYGTFCTSNGMDTIYDFLHEKGSKRLFLIYDYAKRESSNIFFRLFLQRIIEERLAQTADTRRKLLLILDEAPVLEADFGLMQAATLGRGCNMQIILTSQSIEKLYCIAPQINGEHITRSSFSGFPVIIAFHPGDKETIEFLQKMYGTVRKQMMTFSLSRYQPPNSQYVVEPLVSDEDLCSLGRGECYIKIEDASAVRVKIIK